LAENGVGTNVAILTGFGSVRRAVLGDRDAAPGREELERMKAMVEQAMRDGAVGLSSGLFYTPQSFASTDEVVELARVAGRYGGVYDTHLRDESTYSVGLTTAVEEAIEIGRRAALPVNISHIKALGVDVWGASDTVLAIIRAARAEGIAVTADQYPYEASGTSLTAALVPRWAQAGGTTALVARLADPALRARIDREMRDNLRRRNGPEALLITRASRSELVGRTLAEIAEERGVDPVEAAVDIVAGGGAGVGSFNMSEDDIVRFMGAEFVMTGSDGSEGHPRKYGTYPRKIERYVRDRPVLSLARMIETSTSLPARVFGLRDRGVLRPGAFADIAVFDPDDFRETATFLEPMEPAVGLRYLLVNGRLAVDDGAPTGTLAGRFLPGRGTRPPAAGS